jgi:hypothetical protein
MFWKYIILVVATSYLTSANPLLGFLGRSKVSPAPISPVPMTVTSRVYLDIKVGDENAVRVVIGLFGAALPRTTENFRKLAIGEEMTGEKAMFLHSFMRRVWV